MANFIWREASQDSKIYKQGFVLSSRNMQTASEQSKMNSQVRLDKRTYNEIYEGRGANKVSSVPSNTEEGGL